jgi:hypothetical protein
MEDVMNNYSEIFVLFLILPVVMQIIVPLLMLVGWGFLCLLRTVFRRKKIVEDTRHDVDLSEELRLSRG